MTKSGQKLVIVGAGEFAEIACEYFTHDSPYEVVAFAVEAAYREADELFGLPVVDLETVAQAYPPAEHDAHVAVTNTHLNRVRRRLCGLAREAGYRLASYVSSRAFVWHNVQMGDNCFIFENNVVQYHVRLGEGVVLWSGNHVGHRTVVGDYVFVTSHAVISGYCEIGDNCFLGVNSCFADHTRVARDCIVGMGAAVVKDLSEPGLVYVGSPAKPMGKSAYDAFNVPQDQR
jgi:sugar O-acyltransferase (sialic acid O-acetyltransferase NeuD family)